MSIVRGKGLARWALVAAAAALLCAAPSVVASLPVHGSQLSAGQLRQRIAASATQPYSGYARTQGELGLPNLPAVGDVTSLLSGVTNVRAWYAAADSNRVDVIDTVGERDVYQTPLGQFTWDYGTGVLTEIFGNEPVRLPSAGDLLPPDLARRILSMDPVDQPISLPARRIAGIDAAGLRLRPTDPATTVGQVDIWADPGTGLPLRVEITPKGAAKPIITSQFISVTPGKPDPTALQPPTNGGLAQAAAPDIVGRIAGFDDGFHLPPSLAGYRLQPQLNGLTAVGRYGAGLATFIVLPLPRTIVQSAADTAIKAGAAKVTVPRGRAVVIGIPLLSVLLVEVGHGRRSYLLAGFVNRTTIEQAARQLVYLGRPIR
jgi:hypothetical protein